MSKKILDALPELVNEGLVSEETSEHIREYYRNKEENRPQRMNLVFGIIGSILVGLGIVLIIAHNWDELSRSLKVVLAFVPLILGQVIYGYVLLKRPDNSTWRESSATFLFFAVGASIALVAQVYNIPGNLSPFLFTWMLLCFPLIYIMPSSICSLLYLTGITAYGVKDGYGYGAIDSHHYWGLLLLVLPHYVLLIIKMPNSNFTLFHHWLIPLSLTICLGTVAGNEGEFMVLAYISLFGAFYLLGTSNFFSSIQMPRGNGYLVIGSLGTMVLLLAASFRDFWSRFSVEGGAFSLGEILAIVVPTAVSSFLLYQNIKNNRGQPFNATGVVFLLFMGIFFVGITNAGLGALLMNLLVLAAGIFTIQRGILLNHLGILNYGLLIIATLVLCRFFDTDISFVVRGLLFVGVGAGFFFANGILMKKRRKYEQ